VGSVLVHDRPSAVANLLAHEPAVIRAEATDVRVIPIDDVLEVELVLEGARGLQVLIGLAREGYPKERTMMFSDKMSLRPLHCRQVCSP
jgi:hypothetical protein